MTTGASQSPLFSVARDVFAGTCGERDTALVTVFPTE